MAKNRNTQTSDESPRKRGAYPYYAFKACLNLGEIVKACGGERIGVHKSVIASQLKTDQSSSTFAQLVASAKIFGIVDGYSDLMLTECGRDYFSPTSEGAARAAELDFIHQPAAFAFLITKFDGSLLPKPSILANIIGREFKVNDSWKSRIAQMFIATMADCGVLDEGGHLRYEAARRTLGPPRAAAGDEASVAPATEKKLPTSMADYLRHGLLPSLARPMGGGAEPSATEFGKNNVWTFSEAGGTVRLETTDPMPLALWERLKRYIEVLRPTDAG